MRITQTKINTPFVFFLIVSLSLVIFVVSPFFAEAAVTKAGNTNGTTPTGYGNEPQTPQGYLSALYNFMLGLVGVAAMGSIVYGGVLYIISAGSPSRVGEAKTAIWNGIIGILVAGFGYLILQTINPDLIKGFNLQQIVTDNLNKAQQQ